MKVFFLTTSYPLWPGHFKGHFVREAAVKLVELGYPVTVVAPGEFDSVPYEVDSGVEIYRFSYFPLKKMQCLTSGNGILPNIKKNRLSIFQIPIFVSFFFYHASRLSIGHDMIHAHWSVSGLPALWCRRQLNIPIVLSLRGSDYSPQRN
ncbi:MAG: glycosyltransferase, partial [SAR324 cluster bacterium]|nr:glycosyltransferase [SAR324 cluster bacterium]